METSEKSSVKERKQEQKKQKPRQKIPSYTADQKCQAVLSVWQELQSPSQICRELSITWTILNQWQERAMEGMLQALEPRTALDAGTALSPRLLALLERKKAAGFPSKRLADKLKNIQEQNDTPVPIKKE